MAWGRKCSGAFWSQTWRSVTACTVVAERTVDPSSWVIRHIAVVLESCVATQSEVNRQEQEGTKHTPLMGLSVGDQCGGCVAAYPHHLGVAHQEVQDPGSKGCVQSQGL
jgi:hypothetical protein